AGHAPRRLDPLAERAGPGRARQRGGPDRAAQPGARSGRAPRRTGRADRLTRRRPDPTGPEPRWVARLRPALGFADRPADLDLDLVRRADLDLEREAHPVGHVDRVPPPVALEGQLVVPGELVGQGPQALGGLLPAQAALGLVLDQIHGVSVSSGGPHPSARPSPGRSGGPPPRPPPP